MKNNLLVTILFLVSCSLLISQDLKIKDLKVDSKNNGTIINFDLNKKIDLEDVTAWYSSEWFYITIYGANADSLSLVNYKNEALKSLEVSGAVIYNFFILIILFITYSYGLFIFKVSRIFISKLSITFALLSV